MPNVKLITERLIDEVVEGIRQSDSIYILTSFLMRSGVQLLAPFLKEAFERGAEVKVCAGDYLFVTHPDALENLLHIHDSIEVRLFKSNGKSFHPKAYLFGGEKGDNFFIVGSSNLSRSALTTGVEWNISLKEEFEPVTYAEAFDQFSKIFEHELTLFSYALTNIPVPLASWNTTPFSHRSKDFVSCFAHIKLSH